VTTTTSLQETYAVRAVEVLAADDRVVGAWMKGSLATGAAGRYSDVDIGVAVRDEHYESFCADCAKILAAIGPLVGLGASSGGSRVMVALFADLIEFDLTIDPLSASEKYGPEIGWILFDKTEGQSLTAQAEKRSIRVANPNRAQEIVTAFWLRAPRMRRWVAQADLHRAGNELQAGRSWLVELMLIANQPDKVHTVQKESFLLLSPGQWEELKAVYVLASFTPRDLAGCMIRLIDAISKWGRAACVRQGSEYPVELERLSATEVVQFYKMVFGPLSGRDNGYESG
jgi:predicted nucleotidyltransferase